MHRQVHNSIGSFNAEKRKISADPSATSSAKRVRLSLRRESLWAGCILALLLVAVFFPAVLGTRTLLASAWTAPSVMPSGARLSRGAAPPHQWLRRPTPARRLRHWNPGSKSSANNIFAKSSSHCGIPTTPMARPLPLPCSHNPSFPLTALLSLHPTPWTYNVFSNCSPPLGGHPDLPFRQTISRLRGSRI